MTQSTEKQGVVSAPGSQAGLALLESLTRAARQLALYGLDHPIARAALDDACAVWRVQTGEIRADEVDLLWNGSVLPSSSGPANRMREAMRERLIACIRVDQGADPDDLAQVLLLLSRDPQEVLGLGGAMRAYRGGSSVHVEDVDFTRELRESEAAWLETCEEVDTEAADSFTRIFDCCVRTVRNLGDVRMLSRLRSSEGTLDGDDSPSDDGSDPAQTTNAVANRVAHAIQCAGEVALSADEDYWEGWRQNVTALLLSLTPEWRGSVFRARSGRGANRSDMLALIASGMSSEQCVGIILDFPGAIQSESSRGLARALSRIVPDEERIAAIEPLLHAEALRRGISEDTYRNVVGLLISRARQNLTADAAEQQGWTLDEMAEMTHTDRDGEQAPELGELLETTSPGVVRQARIAMLLELLGEDLDIDKYRAVLDALVEESRRGSEQGDTKLALEVLSGLQRAAERDTGGDADRRAIAIHALQRTGTATAVAEVLAEIGRADLDRTRELVSLLAELGDEGMAALVSVARDPDAGRAGDAVAAIVKRDGASSSWLRRLLTEATADATPRIIRSLLRGNDRQAITQLSLLADHPSLSVKLDLIGAIREAGASAAPVLERLLGDQHQSVRTAAIRALGETKAAEAVPLLCRQLSGQAAFGEGAREREVIAAALGEIGAAEAVPALSEALLRPGMAGLLAGAGARAASAAALGKIGGAAARDALERGARSRSRAVKSACQAILAELARPKLVTGGAHGN
jgi:hypothetical protein